MDRDAYYQSHEKLPFIGAAGQARLQQAKILVVGAGGLGCPCLKYLAGSGFGIIGIIDADTVAVSNLHRQILYDAADTGRPKAMVAAEKLKAYNPFITVQPYPVLVEEANVLSLVKEYDLVIDCTDNFEVRYLLNDACVALDKPLVYGAIHREEGHLTVFNYRQSATLRCLFPESGENDSIQSCADIGAYNITTGIIGLLMANEAIKIATEQEGVLAGKLYYFDALSGRSRQISYRPVGGSREKSIVRFEQSSPAVEITADALRQIIAAGQSFMLVDVREAEERLVFNIGGKHIPLQQFLRESFSAIDPDDTIIIYCERGGRSLQSARYLRAKGFAHAYSLRGGMQSWRQPSS
ncbi:MAG TPA: HesA/MoeB/ThiF family protein [Chitinophagaceae bacterium]|jgi:adenylyltransferase/sulfurtransferase